MPTHAAVQNQRQPRKPYHTPRLEDYGAVNELTRSGAGKYTDGIASYSSVNT
jgi:hypothetical protein